MIYGDAELLSLADAFCTAALDCDGWYGALDRLACATGSRSGELVAFGSDATIPFNLMTNIDPAFSSALAEAGGGDPAVNPRVGAGSRAPILQVLAECDFISPDEYRRNAHYQEFARPWDIPYICLTTLERRGGMLIGLAVLRSEKQGHIQSREREVFTALAPHVRAAIRMQMVLEGQGTAMLTGALDALSLAAFICDGRGDVKSLTRAAEAIVTAGRGLQLRLGRLLPSKAGDQRALQEALDRAILASPHLRTPMLQTLVITDTPTCGPPLVLDVIRLPLRTQNFNFSARALVVVRGGRSSADDRAHLLQTAYGVTVAEAEIALRIAGGRTLEQIATERAVSVTTVRTQLKSLFGKLGVSRQAELVIRLNEL
jgi:DNA-binding CsgD family transcriptional regulator